MKYSCFIFDLEDYFCQVGGKCWRVVLVGYYVYVVALFEFIYCPGDKVLPCWMVAVKDRGSCDDIIFADLLDEALTCQFGFSIIVPSCQAK